MQEPPPPLPLYEMRINSVLEVNWVASAVLCWGKMNSLSWVFPQCGTMGCTSSSSSSTAA